MQLSKTVEMHDLLEKNVLSYARYTITDRAIPSLEDGLKKIHRRILWSMNLDKLHHNKPRTKSANAVGSVLRFSPHGDASVYGAMVRLANDSVMLPLMDGKGAFSSVTTNSIPAGSARYTEIRMSEFTQLLLEGVEKHKDLMVLNYDETRLEPTVLPSQVPMILLNPNTGIAMGISSSICSFNINEVLDNTIALLNGKSTTPMYPDFPTGGSVLTNEDVLESIKTEGKGTFRLRANYKINKNEIDFYEIPYTTTREAIISSVIKRVEDGELNEVANINDNTGVKGLEITVTAKRGTNMEQLAEKLFKLTPLESTFSGNFMVLLDDKPVQLGTDDILKNWIQFRIKTIIAGIEHDLNIKKKRGHLLLGLHKVKDKLTEVVQVIRNSKNDKEAITQLQALVELSEEQAEYIAEMKLRNLNKDYIEVREKELQRLVEEIKELEELKSSETKLKELIQKQLEDIKKKHGKERMTQILDSDSIVEYNPNKEDVIEDYNLKAFVTKDLYFKKIPLTSMRGNFTNRLKEDDEFIYEEELTNLGEIIAFTNKHNIYKKRFSDIEDTRPSELGEYLPSLFDLEKGEEILFAIPLGKDFDKNVILGFTDGNVAKIETKAYYTKQNRAVLRNAYAKNKELLYVILDNDIENLLGETQEGLKVVRDLSTFEPKSSRSVGGNKFMSLNKDDTVVEYRIPTEEEIEKYSIKSAGKGRK